MRSTLRLLASVKPGAGRYLEPGNPTGLTGLLTHTSPRSTLLYLYGATLDRLKQFPDHSVYRQSTEALTKQRMRIIEDIKPAGWEEWAKRAQEKLDKNPQVFRAGASRHVYGVAGGNAFVETQSESSDADDLEWDGDEGVALQEGGGTEEEAAKMDKRLRKQKVDMGDPVQWEPEPPLEASQISDAESQISAGLIEEVIQVAEGELKLVSTLLEAKVWDELEEKPQPGQWDYFSRDQHTPTGQAP